MIAGICRNKCVGMNAGWDFGNGDVVEHKGVAGTASGAEGDVVAQSVILV